MYRFYLYHADRGKYTRIKDPVGWNSLGKTIKRDMAWHGIFFEYTPKLQFIKDGKEFIKFYYEKYGIEAMIILKIMKRDTATGEYLEDYIGRLNLTSYRVGTIYAECNLESSSQLLQKIKNRQDVKVDLAKLVSQGGKAITPFANESYNITLHSRVISKTLQSNRKTVGTIYGNSSAGAATRYLQIAFSHDVSELGEVFDYADGFSQLKPDDFAKHHIKVDGVSAGSYAFRAKFRIKARAITIGLVGGSDAITLKSILVIRKKDGSLTGFNQTHINTTFAMGSQYDSGFIDVDWTYNYTAETGEEIYFYWDFVHNSPGANLNEEFIFDLAVENYFKAVVASVAPVSVNKTQLWHEAFARVLQSITDTSDPFRSNFYGRTDSAPITYAADGAGSLKSIINGHLLRGSVKPLYCTLKQLIDASMAMDGVGISIEKVSGVERVRVESLSFFYQAKRLMRLDYVKDIEKEVAEDMYANELDNGNDVWTNNKTTNNDEYNAARSWTLPITQLKKKLSLRNPYITSGSLLETVRRLSIDPTKDTEQDNSNFVIQLRRNGGFEPDRNQDFSTVTGIIDPASAYNLKLSPKRCLLKNGKTLRSFLEKYKDQSIKFSFGDGNTGMSTRLSSETADVVEAADQLISSLDRPLFLPEVYSIKAKLTRQQLIDLQTTDPSATANVWQFIEFSDTNKNYKRGYVLEAKPSPDSNECDLTLLRANI